MSRRFREFPIHSGLYLAILQVLWAVAALPLSSGLAVAAPQSISDEGEEALSPATKKLRDMAKPEAKAKAKADLERPPFEFLRGQIAPFEVLPFYKPNHLHQMTIEVRSSREDFFGSVRTQPISVHGSQRDMVFSRPVAMDRNTPTRMSFPIFMPPGFMPARVSKLVDLDLYRQGGLRPTEIWQANIRAMDPHQMLVVVLSRDPGAYTGWGKMMAGIPSSISRDAASIERGRYYRFVMNEQLNPNTDGERSTKPFLPPSMLYWTTISHVIWDGQDPDVLDVDQQRAMIDWLHWGGQLVIVGGADSRIGLLRDSFLAPYLPADPGGANRQFDTRGTRPLAEAYRPPYRPTDTINEEERETLDEDNRRSKRPEWAVEPGPASQYYDPATPIVVLANSPLFVTGLIPRPGTKTIPFGSDSETILAVERPVGRGRVMILATNPTDPSLTRWRGLDTLVRRVILRRPEEVRPPPRTLGGSDTKVPMISGPDLSWFRIAARDTGGPYLLGPPPSNTDIAIARSASGITSDDIFPAQETATWNDSAVMPTIARQMLEAASGLRIPDFRFVAKSLGAYLVLLVPLNWLIFRSLGRKEWAWLIVPPLALVAALTIERLAAYDLGFSRGRDEVAILEMQADYPRGHLTRIGALASTGRDNFRISFPNDLNACCMPLAWSASRADLRETSRFEYMPVPTLTDFQVQPRSLSYYRSEQLIGLPGPIRLVKDESGTRSVENRTRMILRDVTILGPEGKSIPLGEIGPGEAKPLDGEQADMTGARSFSGTLGNLDPKPFLNVLRDNPLRTPVDKNAWRLVAWTDAMIEGVAVEPEPDRVRGLTIVVAHLENGELPDTRSREYDMSDKPGIPPAKKPPDLNLAPALRAIFNSAQEKSAQQNRSPSARKKRENINDLAPNGHGERPLSNETPGEPKKRTPQ